jgi:lysophospholipase L1-like esterase
MRIILVSRTASASSVNRISSSASPSARTQTSSSRINKTNGGTIVRTSTFLFVVAATRYFSTATAMTVSKDNVPVTAYGSTTTGMGTTINTIKKVFCFGDSLTAGTSPPYERELFPYATHLEEALRTRSTSTSTSNDNDNNNDACHLSSSTSVVVRWRGFPGWQATTLRDDGGLATFLSNLIVKQQQQTSEGDDEKEKQQPPIPPLDLIIILAGTNDLAYENDPSIIFNNVKDIHEIAHSNGCKTIALGIPPSGWQIQDSNKVGAIAYKVNEKLQSWCSCDSDDSSTAISSSPTTKMATYVPFPIKEFDRDSGLWAPDGLHFSPEGYKTIGESLSPIVANILNLC